MCGVALRKMPTDRRSCRNGYPPVGGAHCCHCLYELSARDLHFCSPPKSLFRRVIFVLCRTGRVDFSCFCQLLQKQRENFVHHYIAQFLSSCCVIIILSASSFVNAKCDLLYLNLKEYCELYGQLSQSASLFPCVQKCIWHQPTGLSCKAFCTIKIGLILRYTPFVFPTYKKHPICQTEYFRTNGVLFISRKGSDFLF